MPDQKHLRLRLRHETQPRSTRVEVLDSDDNVLGDLAYNVGDITVKLKAADIAIVQLDVPGGTMLGRLARSPRTQRATPSRLRVR